MDIDQLDIFIRVASMKSFTKAAESLFLSQPTVSARIKSLENEIGAVLFDRSRPRNLTLTEQGLLFWDYAQQMLNLYNSSIDKIKDSNGIPAGFMKIGAGSVPGSYLLPDLVCRFKKMYPDVRIGISVKDSAEVISGINSYTYDLGMVGYKNDDNRLEYLKIAEDELVLIAAPDYLKNNEIYVDKEIHLESLLTLDYILREPGSATRKVLEDELNGKGYSFNDFASVIYIDNLEGIKQAVRHGLGVSIVSKLSVEDYVSTGFIKAFKVKGITLNRNFYIVYNQNRILNNVASKFLEFVKKTY